MNGSRYEAKITLLIVLLAGILVSCSLGSDTDAGDAGLEIALDVDPHPPVVGPGHLTVSLVDSRGAAIDEAAVRVEGSMPEHEMQPVFASLREGAGGNYEAPFTWTMGGHWNVTVDATLADGQEISREFALDVAGNMEGMDANGEDALPPHRVPNEGVLIHLLAPTDGDVYGADEEIRVAVEFENFELGVDGKHWHIYDNGRSARMVMGGMHEATLPNLEPGEHEISVYMSIGSHEELQDGASATIVVRDGAD